MIALTFWNIEAIRQRNTRTKASVPVNGGPSQADGVTFEIKTHEEGGILKAAVSLSVKQETLTDVPFLETDDPVTVSVPLAETPEKITAYYLFNPWWTRPAFVGSTADIPEKTQIALFKMKDRVICVLPMVGKNFKATLAGGEPGRLVFKMTACLGGIADVNETLFYESCGLTAAEAVHALFAHLSETMGLKLRKNRTLPEMFKYLGWCSWDAFYTEVTEEKIRAKAAEIREKEVPVRWILIDDGWFGAEEKMLADMKPDHIKFPNGFKAMTDDIRKGTSVDWFGVWHALGGYWDGTAPGSIAEKQAGESLMRNPAGRLVPDPVKGASFYREWYEILKREGIDFVKVDGQDAVPFYYKNVHPVADAARKISFSLESGTSLMGGAVINCMGMAMENILARPSSAVSRNSDDFLPAKEESFAEHLLQNAYNAVYHNEIYCCDWDMFWTSHKHARKHALLRAISGGPVYVSDRIGATEAEVLRPLAYADGRILMMERSARPAEDCIFMDPMKEGALKLTNYGSYGAGVAGGIAVYNLTGEAQTFSVSPAEVPELDPNETYLVYDFMGRKASELSGNEALTGSLKADDYRWYVFLPKGKNGCCAGLTDKYAGFTAVEACFTAGDTDTVVLKGTGNVTFISERKIARVTAGGVDVTSGTVSEGNLHTVCLPESANKTVISVTWKD